MTNASPYMNKYFPTEDSSEGICAAAKAAAVAADKRHLHLAYPSFLSVHFRIKKECEKRKEQSAARGTTKRTILIKNGAKILVLWAVKSEQKLTIK
jgi:hypothetical protein